MGAEVFGRMLAAAELAQALHQAGKLYQSLEAGEIPKLPLPDGLMAGDIGSAKRLDDALKQTFPPGSSRH